MNACHRCGATAYKPILERDEQGAMRPSGRFQCVKCLLPFSSIREWREGVELMQTDESVNAQHG